MAETNTDQRAYRFIISGGGTGGHVFPAIAIANAIKELRPESEILFVGAKGRMEMEKVPLAGYNIIGLSVIGLNRKQWLKNLALPFKLFSSLWNTRKIIKNFKPDLLIGVGGYASAPTLYMAGKQKLPYIIQEQNSYPGLSNRILAKKAEKICVAYEGMEKFFSREKILWLGNPIRQDISNLEAKREESFAFFGLNPNQPTLLVIGGSLGAGSINSAMSKCVKDLAKEGIQIVWQTGKNNYEQAKNLCKDLSSVLVFDFIKNMDLAYSLADIVVSRAGAIAISELCVVGKPAILIPSPNVAEDHQTKNALALSSKNAAILLNDEKLSEGELPNTITELLGNQRRRELMSSNISQLAKTTSAKDIANWVFRILEERKK